MEKETWWAREDSNLQGLLHTVLNRTRIPIPPLAPARVPREIRQGRVKWGLPGSPPRHELWNYTKLMCLPQEIFDCGSFRELFSK